MCEENTAYHQEQDLLDQLAIANWTTDEAAVLLDDILSDGSELSGFDPGVGGAVFALSAAGAIPISSCNGGAIGGDHHSSDTPHILVAAGPNMQAAAINNAMERADVGIVPNGEFAEIFADDILKMHAFAEALLSELDGRDKRVF